MANEKDKIDAQEIKKELEGIDLKKIDEPIILENIIGIIDSLSNSGEVSNKLLAIRLQNDLKQNPNYIALIEGGEDKENDRRKKEDNIFGLRTNNHMGNREEIIERDNRREREIREVNLRSARQHGLIMSNIGASFIFIDIQKEIDEINELFSLTPHNFDNKTTVIGETLNKPIALVVILDQVINNSNFSSFNISSDVVKNIKNLFNNGKVVNFNEDNFNTKIPNGFSSFGALILHNAIQEENKKIKEIYNKQTPNKSMEEKDTQDAYNIVLTQREIASARGVLNSKIQNKEEFIYWHMERMKSRGENITREEAEKFYDKLDEKTRPHVIKVLEDFKNDNYIRETGKHIVENKNNINNKQNEEKYDDKIGEQLKKTDLLKEKTEELLISLKDLSKNGGGVHIDQYIYDCYMEGSGYEIIAEYNEARFEEFLKTIPKEYHENFKKFREDAKQAVELTKPKEKIDNKENNSIKTGEDEKNKEKMKEFNQKEPKEKSKMVQENVENENKKIEEEKLKNQQEIDNPVEDTKKNHFTQTKA